MDGSLAIGGVRVSGDLLIGVVGRAGEYSKLFWVWTDRHVSDRVWAVESVRIAL